MIAEGGRANKVLAVVPQLIIPIKTALGTRNKTIICRTYTKDLLCVVFVVCAGCVRLFVNAMRSGAWRAECVVRGCPNRCPRI